MLNHSRRRLQVCQEQEGLEKEKENLPANRAFYDERPPRSQALCERDTWKAHARNEELPHRNVTARASLPEDLVRHPPQHKTAWLSALVAETPPRPVASAPKMALKNQFLTDTSSSPARHLSVAQMPLGDLPGRETSPPQENSKGEPREGKRDEEICPALTSTLTAQPGISQQAASAASAANQEIADDMTRRCIFEVSPHAGRSAVLTNSHMPLIPTASEPSHTPESSNLSVDQAKLRACSPSGSSRHLGSAAHAWLVSPRGDWYCSSARARVASASMGLSPMPYEELLTLPVPPLFLAADQQIKMRSERSMASDAAEHSLSLSHDNAAAPQSDVSNESPPLPLLHQLQHQLPDTPEAYLPRNFFKNDFAERPDTIWQAHKHTRHTFTAAPAASPTAATTDMHSPSFSENSEGRSDFESVHAHAHAGNAAHVSGHAAQASRVVSELPRAVLEEFGAKFGAAEEFGAKKEARGVSEPRARAPSPRVLPHKDVAQEWAGAFAMRSPPDSAAASSRATPFETEGSSLVGCLRLNPQARSAGSGGVLSWFAWSSRGVNVKVCRGATSNVNFGAAEVERVFETSCCRLREMVEAVEEADAMLAAAAAQRQYDAASRWSSEAAARRAHAAAAADALVAELAHTEQRAAASADYAAAQACKKAADTLHATLAPLSADSSSSSSSSRRGSSGDPLRAACRDPVRFLSVLLHLGVQVFVQRARAAWSGATPEWRRRSLAGLVVAGVCLVCVASARESAAYVLRWLWSGLWPARAWTDASAARDTIDIISATALPSLVSHACTFASVNTPFQMPAHVFSNANGARSAAPWYSAGERRGRDERRGKDVRDPLHAPPAGSCSGSSAAVDDEQRYLLACFWGVVWRVRFVAPFMLVALGRSVLDAAVLSLLRLSLASQYGVFFGTGGGGEMPSAKHVCIALVFLVAAADLPCATLLLFALPVSSRLLLASNFAGNVLAGLLKACLAWILWVREPHLSISMWMNGGAGGGAGGGGEGGGGLVGRMLQAAFAPSLSSALREQLAQLESICTAAAAAKRPPLLPLWLLELNLNITAHLSCYLPLIVSALFLMLAACRLVHAHTAAGWKNTSITAISTYARTQPVASL